MANGQLPGRVAPTSIGQGKSYSEMVADQLGLIQQQRAANLQQRLAQDEKNREFKTQQLQNIYDFDVSGLASGDVALLGQLQKELAAGLDPDSERSYSNSRELVADISFINNVYNEMKRWGETGAHGRQSYQQGVLQPDRGDGTVFVGDENTFKSRNDVWEQGAFANAQVLGAPGQRQIIGDMLDQDGNVMQKGVDFFQNPWRNQPDQFWRQEIAEAAFMDVAGTYANNANVDLTNVVKNAENDWDNNPIRVQEKYRRDKARKNGLSIDDIKNENTSYPYQSGYTDEELRAEYISEAERGVKELRKQTIRPDVFAGTVFDTEFGIRAVGLSKIMPVNTSLLRGDVTHIGLDGDQMVVVYDDEENNRKQIKVSENSDVWASIIDQAGGLDALKKMISAGKGNVKTTVTGSDETPEEKEVARNKAQESIESDVTNLEREIIDLRKNLEDSQDALALAQNTRSGANVQQAQINAALREISTIQEQIDKKTEELTLKIPSGPNIPEEHKKQPAIQGEGQGISYNKPKPPKNIGILESGSSASGSTKEERQLAFDEATRMAREAGHPFPEVVAAQFAKESAWGKSKGASFNYFGIKSSPAFIERLKKVGITARPGSEVDTEEYIDGSKKTIKDKFLAFESPEDAFMAYLMFIDTTKTDGKRRYGDALDKSETGYDYIKAIIEAGYATTPPLAYADSINDIAKTYGVDLNEIQRKPGGIASK